jgi:hypothetical protein
LVIARAQIPLKAPNGPGFSVGLLGRPTAALPEKRYLEGGGLLPAAGGWRTLRNAASAAEIAL